MDISPSRNASQGQPKDLCLQRDNFRCMATGIIDTNAPESEKSISQYSGPTELAHILPFSIGKWDSNQNVSHFSFSEKELSIIAVIDQF